MKIAVVTNFLKVYGGAEVFLWNVLKRLGDRHDIDLFTLDGSDKVMERFSGPVMEIRTYGFRYGASFPKYLFWLNPTVHLLGMNVSRSREAMKRMAEDINRGGYDVVFAQHGHLTPLGFPYIDPPVVFYCHEPPRNIYDTALKEELRRWKRRKGKLAMLWDIFLEAENAHFRRAYDSSIVAANIVLANSAYTASLIKEAWGIKARVVYPGADEATYGPDGPEGVSCRKGDYILSVGSLMAHKAPITAIEAVAASGLDMPLVFVGSSVDVIPRDYVEARADSLGVRISIIDGLSDEELAAAYRGARMVLCTNIAEPFGLVPVEAVFSGTPVVAVDEGGFRETIGACGGGILKRRDPTALGNGLREINASPPDMKRARGCMKKRFNWNKTVSHIEDALIEAKSLTP